MTKGTILLYFLLIATIGISLFRPYIGIVGYYIIAILCPAALWPWVFKGTRVSFYIGCAVTLGVLGAALTKRIDFSVLKSKQNLYLFILWLCLAISFFLSPYTHSSAKASLLFNSAYVFDNMTKVIFFYYISILVVDDKKKYHSFIWVILFCIIFYIIWGNRQYFIGEISRLDTYGLTGPGFAGIKSVYTDENSFAMFFVMGLPFLYFMGDYYNHFLIKYSLWLLIPLGWHAIFLTGSRGGLLGLGVITFLTAIRSKKKLFMFAIPLALILAFTYQAGDYMKSKSTMITDYSDSSVQGRLNAWKVGWEMIKDHPITGVGIANFFSAYPYYSETKPHVAHNTFIQLASESGIVAGLMYLLICFQVFFDYIKQLKSNDNNDDSLLNATREATIISLAGFFVCAFFLNLATYETFYYLLILNAVQNRLTKSAPANLSLSSDKS